MKKFLFFSLLCFNFLVHAQLKVTAELRPRFEYRHGFKQPFPEAVEAANFISQRTRFKLDFKSKDLDFYTSFQNIRVWGDVPQLNTADKNGIALHQAWVNWKISPNNSLKIGRQELVYDNSRMFGNVGWAQQARSHDALIFRFHKNNNKLHLGLAYNQDGEAVVGNILSGNTYKALQYAWFQKTNDTHVWSLLFLNNGLQSDPNLNSKIKYSQTLGGTFSYNKKPLNILSEAYYQGGKDKTDNTLKAYLLSTEINYKSASNFIPGIGFELLSGALLTENYLLGFSYMAIFGLGTLPILISLAFLNKLKLNLKFNFSRLLPWVTILFGLWILIRGLGLGIPYFSPNQLETTKVVSTQDCSSPIFKN